MASDPASLPIRPRTHIVPAAEVTAWRDGFLVLAEAKRIADEMRARTLAAYEFEKRRGFQEGRQAGAEEAARLLAETTLKIDRSLAEAEREVAALVVSAVEQILGAFDQVDLMVRAVQHALAQVRKAKHLVLYVTPPLVEEIRTRLAEGGKPSATAVVHVEADANLSPSAAVLSSELGFVELGIEAQVRALRRGLGLEPGGENAEAPR